MRAACRNIQSDVQTRAAEHLFVVSSCEDRVGIFSSSDMHQTVAELKQQSPSSLQHLKIWYSFFQMGYRADEVYQLLKQFRADVPGNWYNITMKHVGDVITNLLFDDHDVEPGIIVEDVGTEATQRARINLNKL